MKFLGDMGISPRTIAALREQGHDAIHLADEGLATLPDAEILAKARLEGRILLTVDLDFGYLLAVSKANLPTVIIFRLGNVSRDVVESRLVQVMQQCEAKLQSGVIVSVSDESFRVRKLPL
ncbi:MAG: DUF5615 family PIN-like protein [Spirulinaceae cyanobacterium]